MYYAIQDGEKIHVTDYNPDGSPLTCADRCCDAELYYTPQTTDQNGHVIPAKFASVRRADHREGCSELGKELKLFEPSLPLKQAVLAGHVIILSLNDHFGLPPQLWRDFGHAAHARHLDTPLNQLKDDARYPDGRKGHRSESIQSIQDLKRVVTIIHKHGGDAAIRKTFVTWQHQVKSFEEFYIYKQKQQINLFDKLYRRSKTQRDFYAVTNDTEHAAYDMPFLIPFYPSGNLYKDSSESLQSKAIILAEKEKGNTKLIMQHQIELSRETDTPENRDILSNGVLLLASPRVISSHVIPVMRDYTFSPNKTGFVRTHWNAKGNHQFIPSNGVELPKPNIEQQPAFI